VLSDRIYQVDLTIRRWLDLAPDEILELERGEDIDRVCSSIMDSLEEGRRLLEQVKHRDERISLRTPAAVFAIACAVEHRSANPSANLCFRFTSNAGVSKERSSPLERPGILVWEDLRAGLMEAQAASTALAAIRTILKSSEKPANLHEDAWEAFQTLVDQGSDEALLDLVRRFEWGTGAQPAEALAAELQQLLIDSGRATDASQAEGLYERLFLYVFKLISRAGLKRLTPADLAEVIARPTLSVADHELLDGVIVKLIGLESRLERGELERRQQEAIIARLDSRVHALASQQGVLASIHYVVEDVSLEIPPACARFCPRLEAAGAIREAAARHAWTALHGSSWTGKTQLAASVARLWECFGGWVRLRDLKLTQACRRLDRALELLSGIPRQAGSRQWYRQVCDRLGPGSLVVIEDLPRLAGADPLSERLMDLVEAARDSDVHLLTTSSFPMADILQTSLGEGTIHTMGMPSLTDEEARAILDSHGAPDHLLTPSFVRGTNNLARRHPLLLAAVCRYLAQRGWQFRSEQFDELLRGRHAEGIGRDTVERLLNTVEDDRSRELLYRLTLVHGNFSREDARALAAIDPRVDHCQERLHALIGHWVQVDARGRLLVSPVVDAVGSDDLAPLVRRRCLRKLGVRLIRGRPIGPDELCSAVTYFTQAGSYDRAGLLLLQALSHLKDLDHQVDPRGVLSLWYGVPLPERMDLGIRIYLRAHQFLVRSKYGRSTEGLLDDIDELSRRATEKEGWGVLGAAALIGRRVADIDRMRGIRLLRRALALTTELRTFADREIVWPDGMGPECLIWGVALDLATVAELDEWIETVEILGPEQRRRAFSYPMAGAGCILVAGTPYRATRRKPAEHRDWPQVLARTDELARWARRMGEEVLWACTIRTRLMILSDHLGDVDAAVAAAEEALASATDDPRVRFLLSDGIGDFLLRANRPREALAWLERALGNATDAFTIERLLALVNASRATAAEDGARSLAYLHEAGRLARECDDLPEFESARVYGEIAIGVGLAGNLHDAFRALDEGVGRLLACREDSDRWKALFVLYGHTSGYFMSVACAGTPPECTRDGEPYDEPRRGIFYGHDAHFLVDRYHVTREYAIALHLALFADAAGEDERSAIWAAKALELARGEGQQAIVAELAQHFITELVLDDRYGEALEAALEEGAIRCARRLEKEAGRDPYRSHLDVEPILGDRPNENWRQAERWAVLSGLQPAAVRVCMAAVDSLEAARTSATEVAAICRQIGAGAADPELWATMAELFEKGFVRPVSGEELKRMAEESDASSGSLRAIGLLFASMRPEITAEDAAMIHLAILPGLCQFFGPPFAAHRRILVPFVSAYWNAMFRRMRFRFQFPSLVETALAESETAPAKERVQAVLRAVLMGFRARLSPETRSWLDSR
jgi:hypothetical protein